MILEASKAQHGWTFHLDYSRATHLKVWLMKCRSWVDATTTHTLLVPIWFEIEIYRIMWLIRIRDLGNFRRMKHTKCYPRWWTEVWSIKFNQSIVQCFCFLISKTQWEPSYLRSVLLTHWTKFHTHFPKCHMIGRGWLGKKLDQPYNNVKLCPYPVFRPRPFRKKSVLPQWAILFCKRITSRRCTSTEPSLPFLIRLVLINNKESRCWDPSPCLCAWLWVRLGRYDGITVYQGI